MSDWTPEVIEKTGCEEYEAVVALLKQPMTEAVMQEILTHMNGVYVFGHHKKFPEQTEAIENQIKDVIWDNLTQYRWCLKTITGITT